jgi:hypothetical protein
MKYYIGQVIVRQQWEDPTRTIFIFKTEGDPNKHPIFKFGVDHKVTEIRKQTFLDLEATNILS